MYLLWKLNIIIHKAHTGACPACGRRSLHGNSYSYFKKKEKWLLNNHKGYVSGPLWLPQFLTVSQWHYTENKMWGQVFIITHASLHLENMVNLSMSHILITGRVDVLLEVFANLNLFPGSEELFFYTSSCSFLFQHQTLEFAWFPGLFFTRNEMYIALGE